MVMVAIIVIVVRSGPKLKKVKGVVSISAKRRDAQWHGPHPLPDYHNPTLFFNVQAMNGSEQIGML